MKPSYAMEEAARSFPPVWIPLDSTISIGNSTQSIQQVTHLQIFELMAYKDWRCLQHAQRLPATQGLLPLPGAPSEALTYRHWWSLIQIDPYWSFPCSAKTLIRMLVQLGTSILCSRYPFSFQFWTWACTCSTCSILKAQAGASVFHYLFWLTKACWAYSEARPFSATASVWLGLSLALVANFGPDDFHTLLDGRLCTGIGSTCLKFQVNKNSINI